MICSLVGRTVSKNWRDTNLNYVRLCLLFVIAMGAAVSAQSQLTSTLFVVPNWSPYLYEWKGHPEYVQLLIINPFPEQILVSLQAEIRIGDQLAAKSKTGQPVPFWIQPGPTRLTGNEIVRFEDMDYVRGYREQALKTGMLPGGGYTFCVKIEGISKPVVTAACRPMQIGNSRPAMLLQPTDGGQIITAIRPVFRWISPTPLPSPPAVYDFTLVKMMPGQTSAIDAFRTNAPLITRRVTQTQLPLPAELPQLDTGVQYVWSVKAVNPATEMPLSEPDGWAKPFTFSMKGPPAIPRRDDTTNITKKDTTTTKLNDSGTVVKDTGTVVNDTANKNALPPRNSTSCGSCNVASVTNTTQLDRDLIVGDTVRIGDFDLIVTTLTNASAGSAEGTGAVAISWLYSSVEVSFKSLLVNTNMQMVSGTVKAVRDDDAGAFPTQLAKNTALSSAWTKEKIAAMDSYVSAKGKIVKKAEGQIAALKVPIGIQNLQGFTIAISDFEFSPKSAYLSAMTSVPIPGYNDTIAFGLSGMEFCKEGIAKTATLELLQDFELRGMNPTANSFVVVLKGRSKDREGCYISWNCGSIDTMSMDVDVRLPRTWLLPQPDTDPTKQVIASFAAKVVEWKDWLLSGSLSSCTIPNTNGMGLEIKDLTLDMSDIENPNGIEFPENYVGEQSSAFRGLYAKNIKLRLPDGWRTFDNPNAAPEVGAKNLIITKTGLTGIFYGANVIQFPNANIARLSASVDTVGLALVSSSVSEVFMKGRVILPIVDATDERSALVYKASFNVRDKKFDFAVYPEEDIVSNLFAGAQLTLKSTSTFSISLTKTEKNFALSLNGSVGWNDKTIQVPGTSRSIKVSFAPEFQNLGFAYNDIGNTPPPLPGAGTTTSGKFRMSKGTWSFASPQKSLSGFPVTIKGLSFEGVAAQSSELCRAQVKFTLAVNLLSGKLSGDGVFRMVGAIDKSNSSSTFKFLPKFKDFAVDKITVRADLSAVKIDGYLEFYNSDRTWGDGFAAGIKARFKAVGADLTANARFGSVYGKRYWYIEAKAILKRGIPFMTGWAFYGAGIAAWQGVNVDMSRAKPSATAPDGSSASSGAVMRPDGNVGFGFKVLGVIGTSPDPARFNADISLSGQFNSSGGLSKIAIQGDMWMMATFTERNSAPVKGSVTISYDFANEIFNVNANVSVNRSPITGNGTLAAYVNGRNRTWYVKLGEPTRRITLSMNLFTRVNSYSYLMFGNSISAPTGFSQTTINGLRAAGCSINSSMLSGATSSAKSGPGFAAGFAIGFQKNGSINLGVASIDWDARAGAELNLLLKRVEGRPCTGFTGYNQWYMNGSIAVYGAVSVVLRAKPWRIPSVNIHHPCCGNPFRGCFWDWSCYWTSPSICLHCCSGGCSYTLVSLKIGAYLAGGIPNPNWVSGEVAGRYSVLGGLISGSFKANFSQGTRCTP